MCQKLLLHSKTILTALLVFQVRLFFYQVFFVASWFILLLKKLRFFNPSLLVTVIQETFFYPFHEKNSAVVFIVDTELTARSE